MANITMKRYTSVNGQMQWVELNPATTIAQVDGLQTLLDAKQATLTFDDAPTSGSNNPVKSGGIYTAINNVASVAEGKNKALVTQGFSSISACTKWKDSETQASTNAETIWFSVDKQATITLDGASSSVTFASLSLKVGDILYFKDWDLPDWWIGGIDDEANRIVFYKMETTKVDLTNYVTKTTQIAGNNISTGIDTATLKSSLGITNVVNTVTSGTSTTGLSVTTNTSATGNVTVNVNAATNYGIPTSAQITQIGTNATNISSLSSSKADDNLVVHLAGAETITGAKTFSSNTYINNNLYIGNHTGNGSYHIALVGGESEAQIRAYNGTLEITPDADGSPEHTITFDVSSLKYADGEAEYEYNYPTEDGTISLNHTFLQSGTPTSANTGDIWFVTAS